MQNFHERLRLAIERSGKSKGSLAKSTGVALSTVSRWLSGAAPRVETIGEIASFLGVDAKWLSYGEARNSLQESEKSDWSDSIMKEDERPYRFTPDPDQQAAAEEALARSLRGIGLGLDAELSVALTDIRVRLQQLHLASEASRARYIEECHQQIDRYAASVAEKFKNQP